MTARAAAATSRARGRRASLRLLAIAGLSGFWAAPGHARIGTAISLFNDLRFRGYSLSERRPVAILDFAYDDPSGAYASAAATGVLKDGDDPALLGLQLTGGYTRQLKSGTTVDLGVTHSDYSNYSKGNRGSSYTEIYAGLARGGLSSRLAISPHYFASRRWTAYGEVNGKMSPAPKWSIDAHAGVLVPLRSLAGDEDYRSQFDWRIGLSHEIGRISLHAAWAAGAPGKDYYGGHAHSKSALVFGASWIL